MVTSERATWTQLIAALVDDDRFVAAQHAEFLAKRLRQEKTSELKDVDARELCTVLTALSDYAQELEAVRSGSTSMYMRVADVAYDLSVSQGTIRRWIRQGLLPSCLVEGVRLVRRSDFNAFCEAGSA